MAKRNKHDSYTIETGSAEKEFYAFEKTEFFHIIYSKNQRLFI